MTRRFLAGGLLVLGVFAGTAGAAFAQVGPGVAPSPTMVPPYGQLSCPQSFATSAAPMLHVVKPAVCGSPR
ncbi:MAG: hypothetical protein QOK39_838 [Acidimicrobiaceae bacterium]|jgi:hypothetical protein|nr:hypothetical protein [Acidimicrobiaceae bacterium]